MKHLVTLIQQTIKYDGQPVHVMSSFDFPTMQEACHFVDDSRREGEAGDIIERYTDDTLIEKWTVR